MAFHGFNTHTHTLISEHGAFLELTLSTRLQNQKTLRRVVKSSMWMDIRMVKLTQWNLKSEFLVQKLKVFWSHNCFGRGLNLVPTVDSCSDIFLLSHTNFFWLRALALTFVLLDFLNCRTKNNLLFSGRKRRRLQRRKSCSKRRSLSSLRRKLQR